ncbi:hypothetical protein FMO87_24975 [Salmonella enterica]|nr:hypothetical protein [Salmonella enterica]
MSNKIVFVNGKSKCGCVMAFSDGGGEYSDVHTIIPCAEHSMPESALTQRDDMRDAREKLEAAEHRIAEHRKVLNSLAAVARRYLPDYDEHPEIQAADELLESAAGIKVKGNDCE